MLAETAEYRQENADASIAYVGTSSEADVDSRKNAGAQSGALGLHGIEAGYWREAVAG